jgi:hypothetical protein
MGRKRGSKNCFKKADCKGLSRTRLYRIWNDMKTRCYNNNCKYYKDYGGRGITICNEWFDFLIFREWALKNGYNDKLEIDRINVNGNYCPENCRFVTDKEQTINRRVTRFYTIGEKTLCLKDWCDTFGIEFSTASHRLSKGWPIEKVLLKKTTARIANDPYIYKGVTLSLKEWCIAYKIKYTTFLLRVQHGMSNIDALIKPVQNTGPKKKIKKITNSSKS